VKQLINAAENMGRGKQEKQKMKINQLRVKAQTKLKSSLEIFI